MKYFQSAHDGHITVDAPHHSFYASTQFSCLILIPKPGLSVGASLYNDNYNSISFQFC